MQERWSSSYRNSSGSQRLRLSYQLGRALSEWQVPQLAQLAALRRPAQVLLVDYCLNDATLLVAWHSLAASQDDVPPALVMLSPEAAPPRWVLRAAGAPAVPLPHLPFLHRLGALALAVLDNYRYYWRHLPAELELAVDALSKSGE